MCLLLLLMYGHEVPKEAAAQLLFKVISLADRFGGARCMDAVLEHLASLPLTLLDRSVLDNVVSAPTGVTTHEAFQRLLDNCSKAVAAMMSTDSSRDNQEQQDAARRFIVRSFSDVPATARSEQLRQRFCSLPVHADGLGDCTTSSARR